MTKRSSQIITQLPDSDSRVSNFTLRNSTILKRLTSSQANSPTKEFSKFTQYLSTEDKSKNLKINKIDSFDTTATLESHQKSEEQKFVISYKNDLFFRKKVNFLIKEYERRNQNEQEKSFPSKVMTQFSQNTLKSKKRSDDMKLLELYQKCKKLISQLEA